MGRWNLFRVLNSILFLHLLLVLLPHLELLERLVLEAPLLRLLTPFRRVHFRLLALKVLASVLHLRRGLVLPQPNQVREEHRCHLAELAPPNLRPEFVLILVLA